MNEKITAREARGLLFKGEYVEFVGKKRTFTYRVRRGRKVWLVDVWVEEAYWKYIGYIIPSGKMLFFAKDGLRDWQPVAAFEWGWTWLAANYVPKTLVVRKSKRLVRKEKGE